MLQINDSWQCENWKQHDNACSSCRKQANNASNYISSLNTILFNKPIQKIQNCVLLFDDGIVLLLLLLLLLWILTPLTRYVDDEFKVFWTVQHYVYWLCFSPCLHALSCHTHISHTCIWLFACMMQRIGWIFTIICMMNTNFWILVH